MIYVTSDLHGCSLDTLTALLDRARFSDEDFLFVLGDVIDRGPNGAQLLLWMTQQPNVALILGNHEAQLLACSFVFQEVSEKNLDALTGEKMQLLENWIQNGGGQTLRGFQRLLKEDPESVEGILDYLQDAPLYECLTVKGRRFVLVHAGLEGFRPDRPLADYEPEALLMARPERDTQYWGPDITVIFGHTPTLLFGEEYRGKALRTPSWICIDTGVAYGNAPMLLRLEDGKEFYLERRG